MFELDLERYQRGGTYKSRVDDLLSAAHAYGESGESMVDDLTTEAIMFYRAQRDDDVPTS